MREYKAGKYDEALKEYERLLQKKSDDPRLHFNAGAAAYRNRQFDEAAKQFNATLSSPDLKLQGLAYYNEGNSLYHLGEQNPDPKQRTDAWEKAIADYQSTLKLNPKDADAKFNYEFVKRRLEELKQQQQQQNQQNNQDQNQKQDQQKQQQGQNQQQNQPKQQNGQQQKQQQQQAQQDQTQQSAKQQQAEQQKKEQEQKQAAQKAEQQKQQQAQQQAGQPKEKSDEKDQQAAQAMAQMTPEQAKQLLDAQKGDEQMLPPKDLGKPVDQSRSFKDW